MWSRLRRGWDVTHHNKIWSGVICGLLVLTFCLGLPQFHYTVALMIAVILRYKDKPYNKPLFRLCLLPERS